ncbi:MAG TPA: DUF1732 domain-containing protein, partial [Chryseosolibacter sp.]|nr:DUF1732 domain-containing protein [Chryseosolibacter sp.]
NMVSERLERGKVSVSIEYEKLSDGQIKQIYNETLFVAYYQELKKLADRVYAPYESLFELALNSPDVIQGNIKEEVGEEVWIKVKGLLNEALKKCDDFRVDEGKVLGKMLGNCCRVIEDSLEKVRELDPKRVARIRERLKNNVISFFGEEDFDTNRLEQEIIFYIEKLDINEEKVRLKSHLDYFMDALVEPQSNGKKLGFIAQEVGREINTIGSKSNDAEIQKHVVVMKEELEKIKEQLNNVV